MQEDYKIFMPIERYSKERKAFLIDWIERITWDASCDPERFLELLKNDGYGKQWALTKMIEFLPYRVIRLMVTKEFLKENVNEDIISQIFTLDKQEAVRVLYYRVMNKG
jgi:hypothetical protein